MIRSLNVLTLVRVCLASPGFAPISPLQTFLLKIVSQNSDGSTAIIKSIPCEAGSKTELCMVEVRIILSQGPGVGRAW